MPLGEPVPNLRSLDLLRSVAELGSIRQAALAHRVSQPAASTRLRSLERNLGIELLDRSSGTARLTPAGVAVVQWSADVLEGMRELLLGVAAPRGWAHPPADRRQHDRGGVSRSGMAESAPRVRSGTRRFVADGQL